MTPLPQIIDQDFAARLMATLQPLQDHGLSIYALTAKYDGTLIQAIREFLPAEDFERLTQGSRVPQQETDWFPILDVGQRVLAVLSDAPGT